MNYAIAFLALILGFSSIYWYISGRKFYTGPLIEAQADDSQSTGSDSSPKREKDEAIGI